MSQLPLSNIIVISVSQSSPGVGSYNTSNLAIFSDDPVAQSTAAIGFSAVAASGAFILTFGGVATASINYNDTIGVIQTKINAVAGQSHIVASGSVAGQSITLAQPGIFGAIPTIAVTTNTLATSGSVAITLTPVITSSGWSGGSLGYAQYLTPTQVGLDYGTSSKTYAMANAIFSQQPNILTGGGQLVIIPYVSQQQTLTFSAAPASGSFAVTYNANTSSLIQWNSTPAQIQAILQAVPGLSEVQVTGSIAGALLVVTMRGVYGTALALGTSTNTLNGSITITDAISVVGESLAAAITRTTGLVQYFGILTNETCGTAQVIPSADVTAAALVVQPLNKILFMVTNSSTDLTATSGMIAVNTSSSFTNTRINYYGDVAANALGFIASYAGLALSVNFSGSNTTTTMHLKTLTSVNPDPSMTQTILNQAVACGADTYVSLQGVPAVFCSGANQFYDQVYNRQWYTGALQVAGFNYLAQTGTKVPQTENGMDGLKGAYRTVSEQAVTNGYFAPGTWNSSTTFGNPAQLLLNVSQRGYYIYSQPVALQSQVNRAARQAPLVQIAGKEAGAIQSSTVIVAINP